MTSSDNIVSELLGAIDTVVGKRLGQLSYDKTIICTIIDDSKSKNGEYKVTDGSVKFWAKCENTSYRNDEQVRVSVPNGDTTQEKFIIGKYVKDDSTTPITYMTPLDSVLQMSGNLCDNDSSSVFGLKASGPTGEGALTRTGLLLWSADVTGDNAAMVSSQIYDIIYVQADFKTILSNYNITSGTYGLILSLGTVLGDGVTPGPPVTCIFDSTQMLGDPYAFGIYTSQAAKFDITNVGKLSSIQLLFYQDGNFQHTTHSLTPENIPIGEFNNILIKNIKVGFGSDIMNVADETVKLFTTDDLRFDNDETNTIHNNKNLKLAWYNKDDNGQYLGFDDAKDEEGNIKFVNEEEYLTIAGENAKLQSQQNYDIPMDENGLMLAYETKIIRDAFIDISSRLSVDLRKLIASFKERCNISDFQDDFDDLIDIVRNQMLTLGIHAEDGSFTETNINLSDTTQHLYDWYIQALNEAAVIYNKTLIPAVQGGYSFKGTGKNPGIPPTYYSSLRTFFNTLYGKFYTDGVFLPVLKDYVTGTYSGYKGIYDDFNKRITKLLNQLQEKWNFALELLQGNDTQITSYFSDYNFIPWEPVSTEEYDNGYCVYWYRYHPEAPGDNFQGKGWTRIGNATDNNWIEGIQVELDAVNMVQEEFKVLIIYNHECYESNVLTFFNQSPVVNTATALLSDGISIQHSENSQEAYQSYSVANTLINSADQRTKRQIKLQFAHADGTVEDKALINAQVYWYLPKESTMLDYDLNDLHSLHSGNNFTNDITALPAAKSDRQRDGFICFYKTIGYGLTQDNIDNYVNDLTFCYRIKNYYMPTASQNTIYCEVIKENNIYKAEITMNFSSFGTSGTDYTLTVTPQSKQAAITASNGVGNEWILDVNLYDNRNQPLEVDYDTLTIKNQINNSYFKALKDRENGESGKTICKVRYDHEVENGVLCQVLEFKITQTVLIGETERLVDLYTYYPIPYASNENFYIEGASTIVYDSQGGNPTYYKDKYEIFKQATFDDESQTWDTSTPDGEWKVLYAPGDQKENWDKIVGYMPKLTNENKLLPSNMWVEGGDSTYDGEPAEKTTHYAYVQYTDGRDVYWSQPIVIMQNRYPSPMLNAWDGKFKIDEENGTIMSTMISAGKKNTDNTFSGVLVGDVEEAANLDNKTGLGVYGFNHGAQSFGFNIDGTAFLGKSGRGRILFNGNSGSISSASYQQNRTGVAAAGMMIDLDDGFIDMLGTKQKEDESYESDGTKSQVHLDVKSPYFYIKSKTGVELIHIGDKGDKGRTPDYYLQTNDFKLSELWTGDSYQSGKDPGAGMRLNLAEGKIQAYNFELRGEDSRTDANTLGSYVYLSSDPADMVRVRYRNNNFDTNGIDVLAIGTNNYILKSFNWWDEDSDRVHDNITPQPLTGMLINLQDGIFEAYAENDSNAKNWFRIDASYDSIVPLAIGDRENPSFKVNWDGSLNIAGNAFSLAASGDLRINDTKFIVDKYGNLYINAESVSTEEGNGDLVISNPSFKVDNNGNLSINGNAFNVDKDGNFWIKGTALNDAIFSVTNEGVVTMTKGSITLGEGNNIFKVTDTGNLSLGEDGYGNSIFSVTSAGIVSMTKGSITLGTGDNNNAAFSVDQYGNLSINGNAFKVDRYGNLSINENAFKVDRYGNLSINGNAFKVDRYGNLSINGNAFKIANSGALSIGNKSFNVDENGNIWSGDANWGNANFRVSSSGKMKCEGATLENATVTGELIVNSSFVMEESSYNFTAKSDSIALGANAENSKIHINGTTSIGATPATEIPPEYPDTGGRIDFRLYIDGNTRINGYTLIESNVFIENNGQLVITNGGSLTVEGPSYLDGETEISGALYLKANLEVENDTGKSMIVDDGSGNQTTIAEGDYASGISGTFRVQVKNDGFFPWQGADYAKLVFYKGILVSIQAD